MISKELVSFELSGGLGYKGSSGIIDLCAFLIDIYFCVNNNSLYVTIGTLICLDTPPVFSD